MTTWESIKQEITVFTDEENDEMDFIVEFISQIINRRKELGISQRELARLTGIKQPAIARIESLKVIPTLTTIFKICNVLNYKLILVDQNHPK